jgi:hypothetical protein
VSKESDRAIEQLFVLGRSLHELAVRKRAKLWGLSAHSASRIIDPSRPIEVGAPAPWARLPKSTRRVFKRSVEGRRPRPAKSAEKIFHESPCDVPEWMTDLSVSVPPQFDPFR